MHRRDNFSPHFRFPHLLSCHLTHKKYLSVCSFSFSVFFFFPFIPITCWPSFAVNYKESGLSNGAAQGAFKFVSDHSCIRHNYVCMFWTSYYLYAIATPPEDCNHLFIVFSLHYNIRQLVLYAQVVGHRGSL